MTIKTKTGELPDSAAENEVAFDPKKAAKSYPQSHHDWEDDLVEQRKSEREKPEETTR